VSLIIEGLHVIVSAKHSKGSVQAGIYSTYLEYYNWGCQWLAKHNEFIANGEALSEPVALDVEAKGPRMDDQRTNREGSRNTAEFTRFERDLLNCFIENAAHPSLCEQLRAATLVSREYTGVGLYLQLQLPSDATRIPSSVSSPINGPQILAPSLPNSGGSLLFFKDGLITIAEVYTYTDEMWGDLPEYEFKTPGFRRMD
jgi:hypothetical protein